MIAGKVGRRRGGGKGRGGEDVVFVGVVGVVVVVVLDLMLLGAEVKVRPRFLER